MAMARGYAIFLNREDDCEKGVVAPPRIRVESDDRRGRPAGGAALYSWTTYVGFVPQCVVAH
jgi:hypothetical protein